MTFPGIAAPSAQFSLESYKSVTVAKALQYEKTSKHQQSTQYLHNSYQSQDVLTHETTTKVELNLKLEYTSTSIGYDSSGLKQSASSGYNVEEAAENIASLSTRMFGLYQLQHPDESVEEQLDSFMAEIEKGIAQGFEEATEILNMLEMLNPELSDKILQTKDLVAEKLAAFKEDVLAG